MTWAPCPHGVRTRGKKKLLLVVLFRPGKGVQSLLNFEPEQPQALSLMQY